MTQENMIMKMEQVGFKRWTKGNMDRMYISPWQLGLECEYYKTGNIRYAEFKGEKISNCHAREIRNTKTYYDLKTQKVYSNHEWLKQEAKKLIDEITNSDPDHE